MGSFDFLKSPYNRTSTPEFKPFTFYSDRHQRFENNIPVRGLQICGRTFTVEKNVNGCDGYHLTPGDGYIIRAINDDTGREQFAPKPMRIVSQSPKKVVLRGYKTEARTPFGYVAFDGDDYGMDVYYEDGSVVKCVFHMYDRDVYIEYMGSEKKAGSVLKDDKYSQIIDNATFNPLKITTDPRLNANCTLPDLSPVFKKELEETFDRLPEDGLAPSEWGNMLCGYLFSLLESYYKNAGYLPKVMMDEIISQVFKALRESRYAWRFASITLVHLKDKMYHDLTTK